MLALSCEYACLSLICSLVACLVNENTALVLVSPVVRVVVGKRANEPSALRLPRQALASVNLGISSWSRVAPFAMVFQDDRR